MEDLSLDRIAALVPEFAVKDLPLWQNTDDDIKFILKYTLLFFISFLLIQLVINIDFVHGISYVAFIN